LIVLFVCSGNICRSPAAHYLFKEMLSARGITGVEVDSAGTLGIEGEPAASLTISTLPGEGSGIEGHLSKGISVDLMEQAEIVLVMEQAHVDFLSELSPSHSGVHLLGEFLPSSIRTRYDSEIPDPIGGDEREFIECLDLIRSSLESFMDSYFPSNPDENPKGASRHQQEGDSEKIYFQAIVAKVEAARGKQSGLSSMEFHLADGWWKAEVPLWVVLEVMEDCAARWSTGKAPRSFLRAVDRKILERIAGGEAGGLAPAATCRPEVGDDTETRLDVILEQLGTLLGRHPEMPGFEQALRGAISELTNSRKVDSDLKTSLSRQADLLEAAARKEIDQEILSQWQQEEERRLRKLQARLNPDVIKETMARLVRQRLLDHLGIPPFE
jgi:protein-tyrosine phosphatase